MRFWEWFLLVMYCKYGDVFFLWVFLYVDNFVVYICFEYIKEIFVVDLRLLYVGEGNYIFGFVMGEYLVLMIDEVEYVWM